MDKHSVSKIQCIYSKTCVKRPLKNRQMTNAILMKVETRQGKCWCLNMLSIVSFVGMTLDKCIVLRIGTFIGCPLCRESHPLCRLKNPMVI